MAFISEIELTPAGRLARVGVIFPEAAAPRLRSMRVALHGEDGQLQGVARVTDLPRQPSPAPGYAAVELPVPESDAANAVALVDTATSDPVLGFYSAGTDSLVAHGGPAAGAAAEPLSPAPDGPIRFDAYGNRLDEDGRLDGGIACLTEGTLVSTPDGERRVGDLKPGDLVRTRDNGDQPVRMIHRRKLGGPSFAAQRALWPVRIAKGSMGFGLPRRDLWVSPQHRMLYAHIRIGLTFNEEAVLVRAKSLCAFFEGVEVDSGMDEVTYVHLVFDRHEIVFAEGAPTESFHSGREGLCALDGQSLSELYGLFPDLRVGEERPEAGFMTLRSWELMSAVA
ncbi:Hint domain-containing protein [Histidinibacterium aquaticum]|uniref:Hint domain-containing protein n=1 Tax=Histidinibacterium aquaticum TaxID=2613962 RepID=A0A5J5GQI5_9RHOB|nr:Hint domain-containing protein [Histidinibacterium aquaticum]KAA9010440.1 Hint domain-containing protein [Histidinibacterium aquaticum]